MDKKIIFIDTNTGTWGDAHGIVFREVDDDDLFIIGEEMTDADRMEYGEKWGDAPLLDNGV